MWVVHSTHRIPPIPCNCSHPYSGEGGINAAMDGKIPSFSSPGWPYLALLGPPDYAVTRGDTRLPAYWLTCVPLPRPITMLHIRAFWLNDTERKVVFVFTIPGSFINRSPLNNNNKQLEYNRWLNIYRFGRSLGSLAPAKSQAAIETSSSSSIHPSRELCWALSLHRKPKNKSLIHALGILYQSLCMTDGRRIRPRLLDKRCWSRPCVSIT